MKKLILITISGLLMGTNFLLADGNVCLYNASGAGAGQVTFSFKTIENPAFAVVKKKNPVEKSFSSQPKFLAAGDKFCYPTEEQKKHEKHEAYVAGITGNVTYGAYRITPKLSGISWEQNGQKYSSGDTINEFFDRDFYFYIDKDNTLKEGKGY